MFKIKLTKIKSNHNNLRTDTVEGWCRLLPVLNEQFVMFSEALESKEAIRMIRTTRVLGLEFSGKDEVYFTTRNSSYHLKVYTLPPYFDITKDRLWMESA
jgi:hypothetical protein